MKYNVGEHLTGSATCDKTEYEFAAQEEMRRIFEKENGCNA